MPEDISNPDYLATPQGLIASKGLITRVVGAWIESKWPGVPTVKNADRVYQALVDGETLVITYDTRMQLMAWIKTAMATWAWKHFSEPNRELDFLQVNPTELMSDLFSHESDRLTTVPLLILVAPEWPPTIQSMEHADYVLRLREVEKHATLFCTRDLKAIIERPMIQWRAKSQVAGMPATLNERDPVHGGFKRFLRDEVQKIILKPDEFKDEIKNLNGAILK